MPSSLSGQSTHLFISDSVTLYDVVGEQTLPLHLFTKNRAIVLIFTGKDCPYFDIYFERIKALQKKYSSDGIKVVLIDSNAKPFGKSSNRAVQIALAQKIPYDLLYLSDSSKRVQHTLNVKVIPEVVVLTPSKKGFTKAYQGPIDNNPQSASLADKKYIEIILEKILINQPYKTTYEHPIGCRIK